MIEPRLRQPNRSLTQSSGPNEQGRTPRSRDYDCGPSSTDVERSRRLSIRASLLERARELGADTLVTISHACQREWCDAGDEHLQPAGLGYALAAQQPDLRHLARADLDLDPFGPPPGRLERDQQPIASPVSSPLHLP